MNQRERIAEVFDRSASEWLRGRDVLRWSGCDREELFDMLRECMVEVWYDGLTPDRVDALYRLTSRPGPDPVEFDESAGCLEPRTLKRYSIGLDTDRGIVQLVPDECGGIVLLPDVLDMLGYDYIYKGRDYRGVPIVTSMQKPRTGCTG